MASDHLVVHSCFPQTVDWWSLGVLSYELMTGTSPFSSENAEENTQTEVSRRILKTDPKLPNSLSPEMKDFIRRLMIKDPSKRLGAKGVHEIKRHKFFRVSHHVGKLWTFFLFISVSPSWPHLPSVPLSPFLSPLLPPFTPSYPHSHDPVYIIKAEKEIKFLQILLKLKERKEKRHLPN